MVKETKQKNFEPKITAFLCNWCAYEGADLAGRSQKVYPYNLNVIRVMCSGRVDPQFILEAFAKGADGVIVLGCHPGDCHYKEGNISMLKRSVLLKKMFTQLGIEEKRFILDWVSAKEADKFVKVVKQIVENVRKLGPLDLKQDKNV